MEAMVVKGSRFGRENGKGFYDYLANGPKSLWPGLQAIVGKRLDPGYGQRQGPQGPLSVRCVPIERTCSFGAGGKGLR